MNDSKPGVVYFHSSRSGLCRRIEDLKDIEEFLAPWLRDLDAVTRRRP